MCVRGRVLIGLIDVDGHNYPNLCLMKLSAYHKSIGDQVEWYTADGDKQYDIVYMSKVFGDAYSPDIPEPTNADRVIKGGTGYAIKLEDGKEVYHKELDPPLPSEVENIYPDYSLYPEYTGYGKPLKKQTAYGFLTRGCPRGCAFCHVAAKEGRCARKVADLSQFWSGQGTICLSDPNILACPESVDLLTQLRDSGARIEFNQGLDARLITPQKAELLASMNLKVPHFAMDTMSSLEPVKKGVRLYVDACKRLKGKWNWRNAKVFCLTNFDTTHEQDMQRIAAIQECECQPYVMIYNKPSAPPITRRLQRWTNSTMLYAKTQDFMEYQRMNYKTVLEGSGEKKMRLIVYDCEVFCEDWLVIFKDIETGQYTVIHNDTEEMKQCISEDCIYVGFNSKHYDQFIIKAICCGFTPQEVKQVNDFIIGGGQGWECPMLRDQYFRFNNVDIKDDMQMGLSLKAIEGHLGMSVEETSVSFDIDRPLTEEELKETVFYCKHDVDTTEKLVELRRDYLKSKINIGRLAGIDEVKAMGMTNAKLTAALLQGSKKPHDDERQYQYPPNLKRDLIPPEVFEFFDRMKNPELSDKEIFSSKIEIMIGDCPVTIGYGGIHGAIPNYLWKEECDPCVSENE